MRVPAGALTEAACSVEAYLPLHRPLDDDDGVFCTIRAMCGGSLCPAISSGCSSWVGMSAERSVSLPARRVLGDPPRARPLSFALGAPEGVYLSLLSVCPSLPLFCARRAPAKMMRNAEKCRDLEKSQGGPALCAISTISSGPRYVQTAAENCRGVGALLCVVLGSDSGLTMCKTHFIKL